jgi:hypothetical protein
MYSTISESYKLLNQELHERPRGFGGDGDKHHKRVRALIDKYHIIKVLDYGAGQCKLEQAFIQEEKHTGKDFPEWRNYDPAIDELSEKPGKQERFDLVVCTDVLEHVEPCFLENVLAEICDYSAQLAYLAIACQPANKTLPDGRNAHLIQEPPWWWLEKLSLNEWHIKEAHFEYPKDKGKPFEPKRFTVLLEKDH